MSRSFLSAGLVALLTALAGSGCGEGELFQDNTGAAYEPEEEEGRLVFSQGLSNGARVEVCKTGGVGLNLRTGPGTKYQVIRVMSEDQRATILAASGSWYKIDAGSVGWSHSYYLCAVSGGDGSGGGGASGGGGGGCSGSFVHPAPGSPVTSNFGDCRDGCSRRHQGIDLGVPIGTAVHAADGGTVEFAGWMSGYGYAMDVNHCGKRTTRYAHLSHFVAHHGQRVDKGQTIAKSGNTGNGTGPHLHFEIRQGGRWGTAVNPRNFIHF